MATIGSPTSRNQKKTVNDFKFIKEIGSGSYSTVFLAIETGTNRELAIKAVSKDLVTRLKKTSQIYREKDILTKLSDCSYAVKLYCTFQDERTLYFALTYCSNGDLLQYITSSGRFKDHIVQFYAAELVEALEQLHNRQIIHRDLKPENILLTDSMHIQLTDFGSGVIIDSTDASSQDQDKKTVKRTNSFVGTAQFVAPEILKRGLIHVGSDLWSLGCIIFQMATGKHLFSGTNEYDIINSVTRADFELPADFPPLIGDLVKKLVRLVPDERLGATANGGMDNLKSHPFFNQPGCETKWDQLLNEKSPLASKPELSSRPKISQEELEQMTTGFDARVEARLIGLRMASDGMTAIIATQPNDTHSKNDSSGKLSSTSDKMSTISPMLPSQNSNNSSLGNTSVVGRRLQMPDHAISLSEQASKNVYHKFVQNNLILKQGILDKKKGLFAKRRMFLITEGPSIYYVDPDAMELKGTISWTADLRLEQKDMKTFLIHIPGRSYHLTDPEQDATGWCKSLSAIHSRYYSTDPNRRFSTTNSYSSGASSISTTTVPITEL